MAVGADDDTAVSTAFEVGVSLSFIVNNSRSLSEGLLLELLTPDGGYDVPSLLRDGVWFWCLVKRTIDPSNLLLTIMVNAVIVVCRLSINLKFELSDFSKDVSKA
jgi:hypothetical protein